MAGPERVLISAPSLDSAVNVSGISSVVSELSKALRGQVAYEYVRLGAPQVGGLLGRRAASLACIFRAMWVLLTSDVPIFHSNTAFDMKSIGRDAVMILLAKASGKRVLLHVHGGGYVHETATGVAARLIALLLRLADRVVFLSATEMRGFAARYPTGARKMRAIYNAIDLSGTDTPKSKAEGGLAIAFVGRLVPTKGIQVIIDAALASYPCQVDFYLHGDGPLRECVDLAVAANPRLHRAELFPHERWREVLRRYNILLLPSLSGEGMPMVIVEAMALGVVPITTAIASIPEIVENEKRGLIVPCDDTAAIVDAISRLATNRSLLNHMSEQCHQYARQNFDVRINALRFLEMYCSMRARSPEPRG